MYKQDEERAPAEAIGSGESGSRGRAGSGRFHIGHGGHRQLRPFVDAFFDKVTVNVEDDPKLRENRLELLNESVRPPLRWRIFPRSEANKLHLDPRSQRREHSSRFNGFPGF